MGTTGLIYAAIVAVWAAYLVPLWLRRHDEESASRSADRFSSAMRVLARRQARQQSGSDSGLGSGPDAGPTVGLVGSDRGDDPDPSVLGPSVVSGRVLAATRRRRTFVVLLAVTTGFTLLAAVDLVPWWTCYGMLAIAVGFLGFSARVAARHRMAVRDAIVSAAWPSGAAASSPGVRPDEASSEEASGEEAPDEAEPVVALLPDDFAVPPRDENLWDPVEVPLPTYVTKDPAPRTARRIELGSAFSVGSSAASGSGSASGAEHRSLLDESERSTTGIQDELYDREQYDDFGDRRAVGD